MLNIPRLLYRRWRGIPDDPTGYVYYARLNTDHGRLYKVGFTTKPTLKARMSYGNLGDERLIEKELLFAFRSDAYDVEQRLHRAFKKHLAFGKYSNDPNKPLPGRGQSELYKHDVLGLDDDLYRATPLTAEEKETVNEQATGCLFLAIGLVLAPFTLGLSLLLIFLGGASFFDTSAKPVAVGAGIRRPVHPTDLQQLIDDLKGESTLTRAVRSTELL